VSGTGFSNYLASPPSIGTGTPGAGSFATLSVTAFTLTTSMTVGTGFGCNGKSPQTAYASGGAVATTAALSSAPIETVAYGFTTAAQPAALITAVNNIRAALVANGIMS
jgi:hypothetical protein